MGFDKIKYGRSSPHIDIAEGESPHSDIAEGEWVSSDPVTFLISLNYIELHLITFKYI